MFITWWVNVHGIWWEFSSPPLGPFFDGALILKLMQSAYWKNSLMRKNCFLLQIWLQYIGRRHPNKLTN